MSNSACRAYNYGVRVEGVITKSAGRRKWKNTAFIKNSADN